MWPFRATQSSTVSIPPTLPAAWFSSTSAAVRAGARDAALRSSSRCQAAQAPSKYASGVSGIQGRWGPWGFQGTKTAKHWQSVPPRRSLSRLTWPPDRLSRCSPA